MSFSFYVAVDGTTASGFSYTTMLYVATTLPSGAAGAFLWSLAAHGKGAELELRGAEDEARSS